MKNVRLRALGLALAGLLGIAAQADETGRLIDESVATRDVK
jgi:hypothetical protein